MTEDKEIKVLKQTPGYKHTKYEGTCGPKVTKDDIEKRFYHPYFGGRDAWVLNGRWRAIRHND